MTRSSEEVATIKGFAKRSGSGENPIYAHLRNDASIKGYIRRADEISGHIGTGKRILDWGCGYGHMSYLLKNRSLNVVPYTLEKNPAESFHLLLDAEGFDIVFGDDVIRLPFDDRSFDAVLSSGVIEHVVDEEASLKEINRILKPGGTLFVYMLPNLYSYTEFIATLRKKSCHPRKYTPQSISRLLRRGGFRIIKKNYSNFFPKNLASLNNGFHDFYSRYSDLSSGLEAMLLRIPLLKKVSGVLEVISVKADGNSLNNTGIGNY